MLKLFYRNETSNIIKFNLTFDKGKFKDFKFIGEMEICPNPFCPCHDVKLTVRNDKSPSPNITDNSQYQFYIDILSQKYVTNDKISGIENKKFGKAFIKKLTKENWFYLHEAFFEYKYFIIVNLNIENTKITADFPVYDIEEEGAMLSYHEIFPFAKDFLFEDSKTKYLIDEKYCLNPNCSCNDVVLMFVPLKHNKFSQKDKMAVRLNYKKLTWEIIDDISDSDGVLKRLVSKSLDTIPDFIQIIKKRHEKLKLIYRQFKKQNAISNSVPKKIKIGRNDPCPCGSGKKYKKCCGR